jgi:hypothetical protein
MIHKWNIVVDFDGVLHHYDSPWIAPHVIPDGPVDGAIEWLHRMVQDFNVFVLSTRCRTWRGRRAIRAWVKWHAGMLWYDAPGAHGLEWDRCTYKKAKALVYVDDRALRFDGTNFPSKDDVHRLRPWNKRRPL